MKNTLLFIYSANTLVRLLTVNMKNCLRPKTSESVRPVVTLLKMRPHYSQPSRENVTPSRGTSPLASYKESADTQKTFLGKNDHKVMNVNMNAVLQFDSAFCSIYIFV